MIFLIRNIYIYVCIYIYIYIMHRGFPGGSVVKNPPANARDVGDVGSVPGLDLFYAFI